MNLRGSAAGLSTSPPKAGKKLTGGRWRLLSGPSGSCEARQFTFLAYRYLLVVLARFFAHFPEPKPRNRELLRRWYWRAVLAGPGMMPGGTIGAVRALASSVRPGEENESVQRLLNLVPRPAEDRLRVSDFKANRASGHIMLCALWSGGPLSPDSSEPFDPEALALEIGQGQAQVRCALRYSPERSYRGTCVTRWEIA